MNSATHFHFSSARLAVRGVLIAAIVALSVAVFYPFAERTPTEGSDRIEPPGLPPRHVSRTLV